MKPHRMTLTNHLVMGYGLDKRIHHFYNPRPATAEELQEYHDGDYIEFLSKCVSPSIFHSFRPQLPTFLPHHITQTDSFPP